MKDISTLKRTTWVLGTAIQYLSCAAIIIYGVNWMASSSEESTGNGLMLVSIFFAIVIFLILKYAIALSKSIDLYQDEKISQARYKRDWESSLICSIMGALFLAPLTYGVSFLLFIPQFMLLAKSRNISVN